MLGHFGFSYMGLLYLLLLLIPNLLWRQKKPYGYSTEHENQFLSYLERVGQMLVAVFALIYSDYDPKGLSLWSVWLGASLLCMALYEYWWYRYFHSRRTLADFYSSLFGIPTAGAVLPVIALILLGIYGKVIWMVLSAILFGIGHIGIHRQHSKDSTAG